MNKKYFTFPVLILSLAVSFMLSLILGAEKITLAAVFGQGDRFENIILWNLRLPRALLVVTTGTVLGGSGALFQLFFRNSLAEPGIMGISSGATLGAVLAGVFGFGSVGLCFVSAVNLCAFLGALGAGILVIILAFSQGSKSSSIMLLLCGTALGTLYSAISSMVLLTSGKELHSIYTWILGSFNGRGWKEMYFILVPAILSVVLMILASPSLDLLATGEKSAAALGVEVNRLRVLVLFSGALAVSCGVCAGGTIGFVGLIAPHIMRSLIGPKAKKLIPYSMMFGAVLLLLADTLARVIIAPSEIPAGIITSILGVPFFLSLCLRKK